MDVSLSELREMVMNREAWRAAIHGVAKSRTWLSDWTELNCDEKNIKKKEFSCDEQKELENGERVSHIIMEVGMNLSEGEQKEVAHFFFQ